MSELAAWPLFELVCGLMLLEPEFGFCESLCDLMLELDDGFWLLLDDEFEVLCAAAASVNTRKANIRSSVTCFIFSSEVAGIAGR